MRLFLVAVGLVALAGCQQVTAGTGAVRVEIFYATFQPGCLSVTATDAADASRTETQQLVVEERRSGSRTVAVFRKPEWGRTLRVTASARERSCEGPEVATSTQEVEIPEKGSTVAYLDLRAEDLDGDGFVAARGGGSDCDDSDAAVRPGALETCDGKDSNCSGSEEDASDTRDFYVDADGDGYGNALVSAGRGCVAPAGRVFASGDCKDDNPAVHPGQEESRCDGQDENCDGTADERFQVGGICMTEQRCAGTWECAPDERAAQCATKEVPKSWYVDADGDGRQGTALPQATCEMPAGASDTRRDCDGDASRFLGGGEVCDGLDNDCDLVVDEGGVCAAHAWRSRTVGSAAWAAVTTYARGKAWVAGAGGTLAHVNGASQTDRSGACGGTWDWTAAWARPSDGRVFLGSTQGRLATLPLSGTECVEGLPPSGSAVTGAVTGLVGFEQAGVTRVYAVTSSGHVLRWEWRDVPATLAPPQVMVQLAADLRAVHGLSPDTLLAVGGEDYQPGGSALPRVFRLDTLSGRWTRETLPADVGTGLLRGVNVVEPSLAYAVGDRGLVLERQADTWRKRTPPDGVGAVDLLDVVAFHPTAVLVLSNQSPPAVHRYDGTAWSEPFHPAQHLLSLDALVSDEQWAVGRDGTVARWSAP